MNYVDAGYSVALGALFLYALGLGLRRRRWERALKIAAHPIRADDMVRPADTAMGSTVGTHGAGTQGAGGAEEQAGSGARS